MSGKKLLLFAASLSLSIKTKGKSYPSENIDDTMQLTGVVYTI